MGYILGIDIGITSIGFAGVNLDLKKILFSGVHIFEAAENPKTGASLAEPRRTKRGMRRVIRRRAQRKNEIRQLLLRHSLNSLFIIDSHYSATGKNTPPISPWDLRRKALEEKLTDEELVRVLFHIGKHRGFQSNKKSQTNDGEEGKALQGATDLEQKWLNSGLKTIGAYLSTQPKKRNGNESYDNFIKRNWLREEIKEIFIAQKKFGNQRATQELLLEFAGTGEKSKVNTVEDTIRAIRFKGEEREVIQRIKLKDLKLTSLENMVDKARNIKLYDVLKERLDQHGGDAKKAFATAIYMPVNDPSKPAPRINSVRILTNEKSGIKINSGLASNGDMVRVDVFKKDNKFWLVPIYVHHFGQPSLPNRAIIAYKDDSEWEEMNDDDFIFSIYKNDLIKVTLKKENVLGYYNGTHRGTGAVNIRAHDSDPDFGKGGIKDGIGVKTALNLEKYTVDYFGRKYKIEKEKRLGVAHSDDSKSSAVVSEQGASAAAE